ncbi:MAG: hypothetical protein KGL19_12780 [Bacteroidota bacterium]|nr:hypothetical protein [Bacteroidota bacterium]
MVEVFKTNVEEIAQSKILIEKLYYHFPESKINFDLDDCDRILRVEADNVLPETVIELLHQNGYQAEVLL